MASRWTDSGINWANLALHEDRTSWIIDELYRAFKERESMLDYYTQQETGVIAWDINAGIRDMEKLDEIILGLQTWLNSASNNYSRFLDTTVDPNGQAVTAGFLNGLVYFDSTLGGNLEVLVGVSLDSIRNWNVVGTRIGSSLLQMIYLVLVELTDIITIYRVNNFQPVKPTENIWGTDVDETWDATGANWSATVSAYNSVPSTIGTQTIGELRNGVSRIRHVNVILQDFGFRDSSNLAISSTQLSVKGYNYTDAGTTATYPIFTYDEFVLVNAVAGEIYTQNITHPYAFTDPTPPAQSQRAETITYPIVNINDSDAILYYTP